MEPAAANLGQLADSSKAFARRLFTIGENRLELLMVEVQEERARLLHAILLALGVAAFGFLAILALNLALVVLFWNHSPVTVLLGLTGLYAAAAGGLFWRLSSLLRDWKVLAATLQQLRKDRECLEENFT
jgi:uncharacterized membrane protein YqjE